jgi:hypothetical protein
MRQLERWATELVQFPGLIQVKPMKLLLVPPSTSTQTATANMMRLIFMRVVPGEMERVVTVVPVSGLFQFPELSQLLIARFVILPVPELERVGI